MSLEQPRLCKELGLSQDSCVNTLYKKTIAYMRVTSSPHCSEGSPCLVDVRDVLTPAIATFTNWCSPSESNSLTRTVEPSLTCSTIAAFRPQNQLLRKRFQIDCRSPSIGFPFQVVINACESTGMLDSTVLACKNVEIQHRTSGAGQKIKFANKSRDTG